MGFDRAALKQCRNKETQARLWDARASHPLFNHLVEARGLPGIDPIDAPALRFFVLPERGPATHGRRRKYSCTNGNQPKQCETRGGPRPRLCPHDESGFDSPRPPPCLGTTSGSIVTSTVSPYIQEKRARFLQVPSCPVYPLPQILVLAGQARIPHFFTPNGVSHRSAHTSTMCRMRPSRSSDSAAMETFSANDSDALFSAGPVTPTPLDLRSHCQVVHKGIRPSSPTQQ